MAFGLCSSYRIGKRDKRVKCIITNDEKGKTISINNGVLQFTIPFETIERYLK